MSNQLHNQSTPISEVKEYVKKRLTQIHFISDKPFGRPDLLTESIAKFICSDEVLLITGSSGTGKDFLLDKVILPGLNKFKRIEEVVPNECAKTKVNFKFGQATIFNRIDLLQETNQAQIVEGIKDFTRGEIMADHYKYVFISNVSTKELEEKSQGYGISFCSFITKGTTIKLPDIQTLFYQLPQLIESLVNRVQREQEFTPYSTFINLFEYIESVLWGISDNCHSLRKIISYSLEQVTPDGLLLDFSDDIIFHKDRIELWNGVFEPAKIVNLKQLKEFNEKHGSTHGRWVDLPSTKEEDYDPLFNKKIFVKRFKRYFTELVQYFGGNPLDKRIWEPLYKALQLSPEKEKSVEKTNFRKTPGSYSIEDEELIEKFRKYGIIGRSPVMLDLYNNLKLNSPHKINILIVGDTGTGKELLAKSIHQISQRDGDFITVDCSAISEMILESELFGHVKGAYTGALEETTGAFEQAKGGTIFLDEIGDMSYNHQGKVRRAIQENKVKKIGGKKYITVDVRIVCATNKDLPKAIKSHEFREDLYNRINDIVIHVPRLAERKDDIPAICCYFFKKYREKFKVKYDFKVSDNIFQVLTKMDDFDNIRLLEHKIARLVIWLNSHPTPNIHAIKQFLTGNKKYIISGKMNGFKFTQDKKSLLKKHIQFDYHWQTTAIKYYKKKDKRHTAKKEILSIFLNVGNKFKFKLENIAKYLVEEELLEQAKKEKFLKHLNDCFDQILDNYPEEDLKKRLYYERDIPIINKLKNCIPLSLNVPL